MKELRMHGRGGQGIVVGGEILSNAFLNEGKYLAVMPSYGVERRGSDVTAYGRLSDKPVREKSMSYHPDYLVIFDPSQVSKPSTYTGFVDGGIIISCSADPEEILAMGVKPSRIVLVDGIRIAFEVTGNNLTNMIMCGAFARSGVLSLEATLKAIRENLPAGFVKTSLRGAERGYNEAVVYDYDVKNSAQVHHPQWYRRPLACKTPDKPKYEAPWGNFEDSRLVMPTGSWKVTRPVVDKTLCIKCGICKTFCPTQCIGLTEDGYYEADLSFCKGCGVCSYECPKKAINMRLDSEFEQQGGAEMLKVLSGNKAAAYAAKLARIEVAAVYPITPQSQIGEDVSKFVADGELDCSIIEVEGEHSVMSAITGAAVAGSRVFTATSSLGLAYMTEPMMFAAGMRVPMVMVDVTRETSAQRGISTSRQDAASTRDSGWLEIDPSNAQELPYIQYRYQTLQAIDRVKEIFPKIEAEFEQIFGRSYGGLVEEYRTEDAEYVLMTNGSAAGMVKNVVDAARKEGIKAGLVRIRMYRPYPREDIIRILRGKKACGVIDRSICLGWNCGHLFQEARAAIALEPDMPKMLSYIDGISSLDITREHIELALGMTMAAGEGEPVQETNWLSWE